MRIIKMSEVLTLKARAENYNSTFPKYSSQAPLVATERWLYGIWMIGNNYQNKNKYYGEYPPTYLKRMYSLFPEIQKDNILHVFSGSLSEDENGDRFDINPNVNPTYLGDVKEIKTLVKRQYSLILCDPPYSDEDALHYGVPMINRNICLKDLSKITKVQGFIGWLDQVEPMYKKEILQLVGTIGIIRSTNHRVRMVFIWQKISEQEW